MPRNLPLSFLLLAIVYAPLAYGCTTAGSTWGLDALLALFVVSWLLGKLEHREKFSIPRFPAAVVGLLALIAVAQVLNPQGEFDPRTMYLKRLPGGLPLLPQTLDRATSLELLFHLLCLGAGFLAVVDLAQSRRMRWTMLRAVAIGGVVVALTGFVQKALGGDQLLWRHLHPSQTTYFATFRYNANAASFLNLCWPAAMVLFIRSCLEGKHFGRNAWGLAWLFVFGALFVNTSKFGHAAALPLLILATIFCFRHLPGDWLAFNWRNVLVFTVVLAVFAILALPTLQATFANWQIYLKEGTTLRLRKLTYWICLGMVRDAPLFGFGTGSFRLLFPYYAVPWGDQIQVRWTHAHQDYLQTIIEWGWIGAALWGSLFAPAVGRQVIRCFGSNADLTGAAALTGLLAVLIHSLVDFPLQIGSIHFYSLLFLAILWRSRHSESSPDEGRTFH